MSDSVKDEFKNEQPQDGDDAGWGEEPEQAEQMQQDEDRAPSMPPMETLDQEAEESRGRQLSRSPPPNDRYSPGPVRSPPPRRSPPPPRRRNENPPEPNETVGVFGLSIRTREIDLEDEFNRFGKVDKVTIVYDQRSDRSRGFGFIKMASIEDAEKCIEGLNGVDIHGRRIRVDFSATKRPHSPTPGQYMGVKRFDDRGPPRGPPRGGYRSGPPRRYHDRDDWRGGRRSPPPRRRYSRSPPPRRGGGYRDYSPPPRGYGRPRSRSPPPRGGYGRRSPPPRRYSRSPPPSRRYSRSPPPRRYSPSPIRD
ncbi:hypothetical protein E3P99_02920 [Wallemia hederae]|uniref:RRM domain-containing protein n=1 Tax=Wallemia hederae TaxID=1540922 RepID=A0A4T0FKD7_9BASI|nr:hypothetical protein E3P99_02920 [Wallemia hederae]